MTEVIDGSYRWLLLGGIWLIYFCFGLTAVSLAPLIGPITADLGIDHRSMGLILGAWPLAYIAAALPCGIALDRLSPRISLFIASIIISASAILRGFASGELYMFLAVALFGLGGPLVSIGAPKLVSLWFSGTARGTAVGIFTTAPAVGGVVAVALTNSLLVPMVETWRNVMFVYGAATLSAGMLWLLIASHPAARRTGIPGTAHVPFTPRTVVELLRQPEMLVYLAMGLGVFFVNHGYNNWLPEILVGKGMMPSAAGFWAAFPAAAGIVGSLAIPRLAIPRRRLGMLLCLYLLVVASSLFLLLPVDALLAPALIMLGVARGSMVGLIMLLLMETIPGERLGTATGLLYVAAEVGGVLGPVTVGIVSQDTGAFDAALGLFAGAGLLLSVLCLRLRSPAQIR